MSKKDEILGQLEQAIDNGWMLRPIAKNKFLNIDHEKDISLTDMSHILESVDDLQNFPSGCTAFCIASPLVEDFVCIDLDFTDDPKLEKEIFDICLSSFKKEDLFLRKGNPKKPGQIWFRCFDKVDYYTDIALDVFTTQKRCDAIGSYKGSDEIFYEWPYKKFWEHSPEDLPIIRKDQIEEIVEKVKEKYGTRKQDSNASGGRHDQLLALARKVATCEMSPARLMDVLKESQVFKDLEKNPRGGESPHNEISRIASRVIGEKLKNYFSFTTEESEELDKNSIMKFAYASPPSVESGSFLDMVYKLIRRNQRVDNKKIAFASAVNLCSWLASLFCRYEGLCPNLMILYVAESGGGKSSTTKIMKQLINHIPELRNSFRTSGIGSTAAVSRFISESPVCNLNIDEFSKVMKNQKKEHMGDLPEVLCQWYSDFDDYGIPEAISSLKSETNGIAQGAKLVSLMSTTPAVFNNFDESLFDQGLGRRIFPIIDNDFAPLKKNFEYNPRYFLDFEIKVIQKIVEKYIFNKDKELFDSIDIEKFKFVKSIEKGEIEYHKKCKKSRITVNLKSSKELGEYLKTDFVDEINDMRRRARYFGSSIQSYLSNSAIEHIKKLSTIHALFGKCMDKNMLLGPNREVGMDSFDWAKKTFGHYVIHEAMDSYDEIFNKKQEIKAKNSMASDFLSFLIEKQVLEFTKSTKEVHNFFKDKKNSRQAKSTAINNLIESNKLVLISGKDADSRGAKFKVDL